MRTWILSAAFAAALAATTPSRADAQIIYYPQISQYPSLYTPGYNLGYNYGYNYFNPYSGRATWGYGWSNPYNYGNYRWTYQNPYPGLYPSYGLGSPVFNYGWRGRRW